MATIKQLNKIIYNNSINIVGVGESKFIQTTSDIENNLISNTYSKVFYHLNPSNFSINNELGSYNSLLNYRIIVVDLLTDNSESYEDSINNAQLILEEIIYKLLVENGLQINNNSYTLQPFINEFSVKLCGWYVDLSFYKEINTNCDIALNVNKQFIVFRDTGVGSMAYYTGYFNLDTVLYSDINLTTLIDDGTYSTNINMTETSIMSSPVITPTSWQFEFTAGKINDISQI